jgi:hypothetical protein
MSCYGNYHGALKGCAPLPEDQIRLALPFFTGSTKTMLKLLAKQYIILSVSLEYTEPVFIDQWRSHRRIVAEPIERYFVVRYVNFKDHQHVNIFEWRINIKDNGIQ